MYTVNKYICCYVLFVLLSKESISYKNAKCIPIRFSDKTYDWIIEGN